MIKIDLITGFLGSGKTTLIRNYIQYLVDQGENICILENDHGAINIDALALDDLEGPLCDIEMIIGGDGAEAHQRRFRTKLISLGMLGYDRVIVEPSGIYDVDEFFDTLHEDPLPRWYEIGNVISLVDGREDISFLSPQASYLLASQAANAGTIIVTHMDTSPFSIAEIKNMLQGALEKIKCNRKIDSLIMEANPSQTNPLTLASLAECGYVNASYEKIDLNDHDHFQSIFYMNTAETFDTVSEKIRLLFKEDIYGSIRRVKGFLPAVDASGWIQINATKDQLEVTETRRGQDVLIIIGEDVNKDAIDLLWPNATTV